MCLNWTLLKFVNDEKNDALNFSRNFPDRRNESRASSLEEARAALVKYARESIRIGLIPSR